MIREFTIREILDYAIEGMIDREILPSKEFEVEIFNPNNKASELVVRLKDVDRTDRKETERQEHSS